MTDSLTAACFAQVTPSGAGGVAVVGVTGPGRAAAAARLLSTASAAPVGASDVATGRAPWLAWLVVAGECVDQVLVVARPEVVELHLHGAPSVLARLAAAVGPLGRGVPAGAADRLCGAALGEPQLALALEQRAHDWAAFVRSMSQLPPSQRRSCAAAARRRSAVAMALARPVRLVLCGRQNAGKSTLFNCLLGVERALAAAAPGLTRDPVREVTVLAGYPYELVDTAGEGEDLTRLDAGAVELGRREREAERAWRLLVVDGTSGPAPEDLALHTARTAVVRTKTDRPQAPWPGPLRATVAVSAVDPAAAVGCRGRLGEGLRALRGLPPAGPVGGPAALSEGQLAMLDAAGPLPGRSG